jgi:hypothetical protein
MTTTTDYQAGSRAMMTQSRTELAQGDLQQASEKGWGAAAQMMKAVAEARGWQHGRHRNLHQIASRLRAETGDRDIYRLFGIASILHENFYENQMATQDIGEALQDVERLLAKLEAILAT